MELSIIIVSYNTRKLITNCIKSIIKNLKGVSFEIIVVDNGSSDGSVKKLTELNRLIKLIKNKDNVGFAKANNQGVKIAKGRYILFLNSDTLIRENVIFEILAWMKRNPKVAVATCALRNVDGSIQGTGGYFPSLFRIFSWMFFLDDIPYIDRIIKPFHPLHSASPIYKGESFYLKPKEVDWVTGAFMLVRKKVLEEVGYFDEDYFMYAEDVDLCFRVKSKGWQIWYLPQWSITHIGGGSSTKEFPILSEYKGIKLFFKKHKPSWTYSLVRFFLKCGALFRMILFGFIKGKEGFEIYAKAFSVA